MAFLKWLFIPLQLLALSGCGALGSFDKDGNYVTHHLGYVKTVTPNVNGETQSTARANVETYGVKVSDGLLIGYERETSLRISRECQLVVLVQTREQLEKLMSALDELTGGDGLCSAISQE